MSAPAPVSEAKWPSHLADEAYFAVPAGGWEAARALVSTSPLRRLGDIRDVLEPAGFRHLRTDLTEPDDEFTDDDDVEFSAIDAMFDPAPRRGPSVTDAVLAAHDDDRA